MAHQRVLSYLVVLLFTALCPSLRAQNDPPTVARLIKTASHSTNAYPRLSYLCDTFGSRLSGSTNLEAAIDWVLVEMKRDGFQNVHGEDVHVPHWVRGQESLEMIAPHAGSMPMLGLGGSIATPKQGITASVLVVKSFAGLVDRKAEAKGRIVVFNAPYEDYHKTVAFRTKGAIAAAKAGAVASLVRSITPFSLQTPHTGNMSYEDGVSKIPHAAITIEDAERLQRAQDRGEKVTLRLKMNARTLPDSTSRNIIAEIPGREKPEEIVLVSGHIDSWDVGNGAQDDGGGCVMAWEAARTILHSGLKPRRTIRVVLWTNEENGLNGAKAYRAQHQSELPKHIAAIESDSGTYPPTGFGFAGSSAGMKTLKEFAKALRPVGATTMAYGCRGSDVLQLLPDGVPVMHLEVKRDTYFYFHHTAADTVDKVVPKDLNDCAAALAGIIWQLAESEAPLPR